MQTVEQLAEQLVLDWQAAGKMPPMAWDFRGFAAEAARRAVSIEQERICAAIKAEDDHCVDGGDYMLDSDDCISVVRGTWQRPDFGKAKGKGVFRCHLGVSG